MRIDEAFRRAVGGYWWLIGLLVVLPAVGAAAYGQGQTPLYSAVARVQMSGGLAGTNVQADAATQLLLGVVTTPRLVEKAMAAAQISGDPVEFATEAITVTRVGVSAVNDVAVVTTSPDRSVIVVDSLVQQALSYTNVSRQSDASTLATLNGQIDALTKERDQLIGQLTTASPGEVLTLQARIGAAAPTLSDLLRQRSDLLLAAPSRASIGLLDGARPSATPLPARTAQLAALAGLTGLLVSLGVVALAEALRPRVRGRRWIAHELRCPSLGHLDRLNLTTTASVRVLRDFAASASLIRRRFRGEALLLVPVDPRDEWLAAAIARTLGSVTGLRVECLVDALPPGTAREDPGTEPVPVVVVALSATVQSQRRLEELRERTDVLGWPIVGVLTFPHPGLRSRLFRAADHPETETGTATAAPAPHAGAPNRATAVASRVPEALVGTETRGTS